MPNSVYKVPKGKKIVGDMAAEHSATRKQANAKGAAGIRPGTFAQEKAEMLGKRKLLKKVK